MQFLKTLFGSANARCLKKASRKVDAINGLKAKFVAIPAWIQFKFGVELDVERMREMEPAQLTQFIRLQARECFQEIEAKYPVMARLYPRQLLLQILDAAWKRHLLAMDHLRHAVGLMGYAQDKPKAEYQRESMALFQQMWKSIGEQTTDLVFRMEPLDEGFGGPV